VSRVQLGERGSVLIESMTTLLALSLILTTGFAILYLAFARVWLDRQVYEGLICLASTARTNDCESILRRRVAFALPMGELSHVHLARTSYDASVRFSFFIFGRRGMQFEDQRRLPLFTGESR
jgi:hypothetical protein